MVDLKLLRLFQDGAIPCKTGCTENLYKIRDLHWKTLSICIKSILKNGTVGMRLQIEKSNVKICTFETAGGFGRLKLQEEEAKKKDIFRQLFGIAQEIRRLKCL